MAYNQIVLDEAKEIAEGCQGGHDSFCSARCPMHTDAISYVNLIGEGKLTDAILKIREKLFLPGTLGRVCAHPCEDVCRRNTEYKQPVSIAALKRYAADRADKEELWDIAKKPATGKTIAVIGAGPAGAQAAIDLAKEGHSVTIYEKLNVVGGMMRVGIPEYRLPRHTIDFEYAYLSKLGINFTMSTEVGRDIPFKELLGNHDAVIVANGAHKGFVPSIKGADGALGITNAVDFLRETSLNKYAKVGENVVVIGGGDVAMDCARSALRLGAKSVTVVSLEQECSLPASKHEQQGAKDEGVIFRCGWGGDEIFSTDGKATGIKLKQCSSVFDAEGKFNPSFGSEELELKCDTLIFAAGQLVVDVTDGVLEQGRSGRYIADRQTLVTSNPKIFIAGDCAGGTIVVEAMALGRKAAISVNRFLAGEDLRTGRDFDSECSFESKLELPLPDDVRNLPRKHSRELDPAERIKNFAECDLGFDDAAATEESSRCLRCECKKCMKECIMLNDFTPYPGALFKQFLNAGTLDPIVAYSCNMCDQCTLVCPEEYKFAKLFGLFREDMVRANGGESPIPGHKAIKMHQMLGFSSFFSVKCKGIKK